MFVTIEFVLHQDFGSREELLEWAFQRALAYNYVLVIGSSNSINKGWAKVPTTVFLRCDRHGLPKSKATVRRTKSKKCNCPFKLKGEYDKHRGVWNLQVLENQHNHPPAQHLEGHAHARNLSAVELKLVERLHQQNLPPRNIWDTIKDYNPHSLVVPKDIANAIQKFKGATRVGRTPMQQLEHALVKKGYVYHMRTNPDTNAVEEVFFVHPESYTMWRAFPHVLMIDATYKTNMYEMPLLQVVGVTSTLRTFVVCNAFLSKEREENFLWVLGHIKDMLEDCMLPRVIVTDRDQALMNAIDKVFPDATHILCRWHISENISKFCKKGVTGDDWDDFNHYFIRVCESPSEQLYDYNVGKLQKALLEADRRSKFLNNLIVITHPVPMLT
jgi:histone-lysine N-methyltransferase SETD2